MTRSRSGRRRSGLAVGFATAAVLALALLSVSSSAARRNAQTDTETISMLADANTEAGYQVLIPNFERVYPNIKVNVTYAPAATAIQVELTELASGNAPDVLYAYPGCGIPVAVCVLGKAGDLAPMIKTPWVKRSLPLVTSRDKYGQGLVEFSPQVSTAGVFTDNALFAKLGLKVPQTFAQLLDLCQKAKAAGTTAVLLSGGSGVTVGNFIDNLASTTVYADASWTSKLRAGIVSFEGTAGWHEALQEFADLNSAGCFQPGMTGASLPATQAQFAQGEGLMLVGLSNQSGAVDALDPRFAYSLFPFPIAAGGAQPKAFIHIPSGLSVNVHSSPQTQAAVQTFIDFLARPEQNALFAQIEGGLTQYEFLKGRFPSFMSSSLVSLFKQKQYVTDPSETWWNANVVLALQQDAIGVITGQSSIDGVLNAMDAAWKQGPS